MAHLTKPVSVITKTQQGEITINLNLTITLDQDGKIGINVENKEVPWDLEIPDIEIGKVVELKKE
jgi:phage-related protein